jgi:hypothetical protein
MKTYGRKIKESYGKRRESEGGWKMNYPDCFSESQDITRCSIWSLTFRNFANFSSSDLIKAEGSSNDQCSL